MLELFAPGEEIFGHQFHRLEGWTERDHEWSTIAVRALVVIVECSHQTEGPTGIWRFEKRWHPCWYVSASLEKEPAPRADTGHGLSTITQSCLYERYSQVRISERRQP